MDTFTTILLVVIGIVLFMATITAISSLMFPNSKFTKFIKKVGEWISEGLMGL